MWSCSRPPKRSQTPARAYRSRQTACASWRRWASRTGWPARHAGLEREGARRAERGQPVAAPAGEGAAGCRASGLPHAGSRQQARKTPWSPQTGRRGVIVHVFRPRRRQWHRPIRHARALHIRAAHDGLPALAAAQGERPRRAEPGAGAPRTHGRKEGPCGGASRPCRAGASAVRPRPARILAQRRRSPPPPALRSCWTRPRQRASPCTSAAASRPCRSRSTPPLAPRLAPRRSRLRAAAAARRQTSSSAATACGRARGRRCSAARRAACLSVAGRRAGDGRVDRTRATGGIHGARLLREFQGWRLPEAVMARPVDVMLRLGVYDRRARPAAAPGPAARRRTGAACPPSKDSVASPWEPSRAPR
jgi:hypothetical protein